ncbi:MAG: hypothetical protein V7651_01025 [Hyphomonas oceanitis]|uniref:hypothetical protein n=1 Tax=Hyphomonas oceanitis TaxID=81033 RepID=UPI0030028134
MRFRFSTIVSALACLAALLAFGLTASAQQKPVDACAEISCPSDMACYEGACFPTSFGDGPSDDPCADVTCPSDMACYEGGCFLSLDEPSAAPVDACEGISCPADMTCYEGGCFLSLDEPPATPPVDPCAEVSCPSSMVCYEGGCFESIDAPADAPCPAGSVASNGACKPSTKIQTDPCAGVLCPAGEACYQGGCFPQMDAPADPCADISCPSDMACYEGGCFPTSFGETEAADPCAEVSCPASMACYEGGCFPDTLAEAATPAGDLEIIALPTGPRTSLYLAIDDATLARDETLRLTYSGLSGKPARIALIYMGDEKPRPGGWFYIPAKTTSGVYEREGHSLAPFTGPYKACLAYSTELPSDASSPDAYADCLDFVVAGTGSRNARPALSLSAPSPKVGKHFTLNWSGFPHVNARISLIDTGTGRSVARGYSSSKPAGEWKLTVREPGSYEIRIYFEGEALRARMHLEVTQ